MSHGLGLSYVVGQFDGATDYGDSLGTPTFSYHQIAGCSEYKLTTLVASPYTQLKSTSASPSPSRSAVRTATGPAASAVIGHAVHDAPAPSFSYHATLSSSNEADNTSISPSPSRSAA